MTIPPGHTEASVLAAIEKAVANISSSFAFGYYGLDDIQQQARVYALELLEKRTYDPARPLEYYLFTHMKRRLINLLRDKLHRTDAPCKLCHAGEPCTDGNCCDKYLEWSKRNRGKANLMRPLDLGNICDEREKRTRTAPTAHQDAETAELKRLIDEQLPVDLRSDYLRMLAGVSIPKSRRDEIERVLRSILRIDQEEDS